MQSWNQNLHYFSLNKYMQNLKIINHNHVIYNNPNIIVNCSFVLSYFFHANIQNDPWNPLHRICKWLTLMMKMVETTYYETSKSLMPLGWGGKPLQSLHVSKVITYLKTYFTMFHWKITNVVFDEIFMSTLP
jgi:hypothetical protein